MRIRRALKILVGTIGFIIGAWLGADAPPVQAGENLYDNFALNCRPLQVFSVTVDTMGEVMEDETIQLQEEMEGRFADRGFLTTRMPDTPLTLYVKQVVSQRPGDQGEMVSTSHWTMAAQRSTNIITEEEPVMQFVWYGVNQPFTQLLDGFLWVFERANDPTECAT